MPSRKSRSSPRSSDLAGAAGSGGAGATGRLLAMVVVTWVGSRTGGGTGDHLGVRAEPIGRLGPDRRGRRTRPHGSTGGRLQRRANGREGAVGVGADRGDGRDAHHDDQGQHDGVLDRRRAIFLLEELNEALGNSAHRTISSDTVEWNGTGSRTYTLQSVHVPAPAGPWSLG